MCIPINGIIKFIVFKRLQHPYGIANYDILQSVTCTWTSCISGLRDICINMVQWYRVFLGQVIVSWSAYHNFLEPTNSVSYSKFTGTHSDPPEASLQTISLRYMFMSSFQLLLDHASCVSFKYWNSQFRILSIKLACSVNFWWMKMKMFLFWRQYCVSHFCISITQIWKGREAFIQLLNSLRHRQ